MLRSFGNSLDRTFGRCPACMRKAFIAALGSWVLVLIVGAFSGADWAVTATLAAAFGLTALWLAHIGVYSLRMARLTAAKSAEAVAPASSGRRRFVIELTRAAALAAVAMAMTVRPASAKCDCSKCRSNQYCCPTAGGNCGCFPMQCPR